MGFNILTPSKRTGLMRGKNMVFKGCIGACHFFKRIFLTRGHSDEFKSTRI